MNNEGAKAEADEAGGVLFAPLVPLLWILPLQMNEQRRGEGAKLKADEAGGVLFAPLVPLLFILPPLA
jgi:hypothetical protein